jgi:hypothetical protein
MNDSRSVERTTWWQAALLIRGQTATDQRNIGAIWVWSLLWAAGFIAVMFAFREFPDAVGSFAWLLAMIPILLGIQTVRVHLRFLREADEFTRKIQLEGIAIGFGAGAIFCFSYPMLQHVGAPELPTAFAIVPLALGWAVGSFTVAARYK